MTEWPVKRELDTYVCKRPIRSISVRRAAVADIAPLIELARTKIGGLLADFEHVSRVLNHNGECIWVVNRTETGQAGRSRPVGFHAFLPLSPDGLRALLQERFIFRRPHLGHIAAPEEQPAALYWWASLGTGTTATAISNIMKRLRTPRYRLLDIYSRPVTQHGARALRNVGFRPLSETAGQIGSMVIYRRLANRVRPMDRQAI